VNPTGFLAVPDPTDEALALFDEDVAEVGYIMNVSKLWSYQPAIVQGLFALMGEVTDAHGLTYRQRAILVSACAATLRDSPCSLAWGTRLADVSDPQTAAAVLQGGDHGLTSEEHAMADWARKVARDPNSTDGADVAALRAAGFSDAQIFAITAYVALRLAFSTVNDALGVLPDAGARATTPAAVVEAVTYGRPIAADVTR
jgi:alkylhydroperoxidase family enzyme